MAKINRKRQRVLPAPSTALDSPESIEIPAGIFKDTCLALMEEVRDQNKQIVVTKYGEPVARLVPTDSHLPSAFGYLRGTLLSHGDIVSPDVEAWGDPE